MRAHRRIRLSATARQRRGANLVEFAMLAPVMFLFIFGIIEFGRITMVNQAMTNAAREGCRMASLATTTDSLDVEAAIRNAMASVMSDASDPLKLRVNVTPTNMANLTSGTSVGVDLEVDYSDVSWPPNGLLAAVGNPAMRAEATQERE